MIRDPSQIATSSGGDFNFSDMHHHHNPLVMHKNSASNFSQELERSGIKSAALKYKHGIPGSAEAIEEEAAEGNYYASTGNQQQALNQQQISSHQSEYSNQHSQYLP